jgi:hypothetical protein
MIFRRITQSSIVLMEKTPDGVALHASIRYHEMDDHDVVHAHRHYVDGLLLNESLRNLEAAWAVPDRGIVWSAIASAFFDAVVNKVRHSRSARLEPLRKWRHWADTHEHISSYMTVRPVYCNHLVFNPDSFRLIGAQEPYRWNRFYSEDL